MAFQDTFAELAKDPELTLEPKNVLLFLFSQLDFENFIHISQQDVASNLECKKPSVQGYEVAHQKAHSPRKSKGRKDYAIGLTPTMDGKARSRTSKTIGVIGSRLSRKSVNYRTVLDRISAWMRESRQDGGDSPGKDCNLRIWLTRPRLFRIAHSD